MGLPRQQKYMLRRAISLHEFSVGDYRHAIRLSDFSFACADNDEISIFEPDNAAFGEFNQLSLNAQTVCKHWSLYVN